MNDVVNVIVPECRWDVVGTMQFGKMPLRF